MSDRPAPRPRPSALELAPRPTAEPAPRPSSPSEPAPKSSSVARPSSRSQRRRAERHVGRRHRLRFAFQILAGLLVVAGMVSFGILVRSDDSTPPTKQRRPVALPTRSAAGANLAYPTLVSAFLGGAASDLAAVTTYDYRSLDDALNAGLAVTTGAYRRAYREALTGDLARTALEQHVVHTFEALDLGIGEMSADGTVAKVLVFGEQRVTDDNTGPDAEVSPVTLCATLRRDGNRYRISDLVEGASAGLPPGGPDLPVAAEAARSEVVNLLSYQRADFDADLQRAIAGATSPLREQIQTNAVQTKSGMEKGNYDLTGSVTAIGVVRTDANSATFLVAADSNRLVDGGDSPSVDHLRYEVTVTRTSAGWAASRITSVDGT